MKPNMHPVYETITAHCQCGNTFETRSTSKSLSVEVCAVCHPYFTGKHHGYRRPDRSFPPEVRVGTRREVLIHG